MKNVGIIFGGVSCEHDVSIITAIQLMENIDKTKYKIYPIYIHSDGEWYVSDKLMDINIYKNFDEEKKNIRKGFIPPNKRGIILEKASILSKEELVPIDVVIPAIHGMNGEDGTIQGLLELANIPYTSSGVLGASVGMDKIIMKKVFEAYNLPVLPYTYFLRSEWEENRENVTNKIEDSIKYPIIIKPSNLGSSIGISIAKNREELIEGINIAITFDERIIVEEALENLKEVNCSVLGRANDVEASVTEMPVSWKEFLTFDEKYLSSSKTKGGSTGNKNSMANMSRKIPAELSTEDENLVKELAKSAFKALNSKGVCRIDFLVDNNSKKIFINEINTIPGSFAFYLWKENGLEYCKLIDKLIEIAELENKEKNKNNYTYKSTIVNNYGGGTKIRK